MKVAEIVEKAIRPLFDDLDVNLVEVEYVKKNDGMHLVVLLDKETGVTLEDCSMVARMVNPILDELDPTQDSYYFDVSSYGLDRPLKYDWQLDRYMGKKVSVKLYQKLNNLKEFDAILTAYNENSYTFMIEDNEEIIERKLVATLLPYIEF